MINDLLTVLERINALPLLSSERAELMRRAMAEMDGGDVRERWASAAERPKPSSGRRVSPDSAAAAVRRIIAGGEWMLFTAIRKAAGKSSGNVATALRDMTTTGEVERKEDGEWPNAKPMVWYRLAPQSEPRTVADYDAETM